MISNRLRRWFFIHKWSSLICTVFLLILCVTGLPLIFRDELRAWLEPHNYAEVPVGTPDASLDRLASIGRQLYPGEALNSIYMDDDEPQAYLWMVPSWAAMESDPQSQHFIRVDRRTAEILEQSKPLREQPQTFINIMLRLHMDLFAGLKGELFVVAIGLLFVIAIVSGVALYGPFMKKQDFGVVRSSKSGRSARIKWLDLHNLLGIVVLVWTLAVGVTGVMNGLSTPLFALWQQTDVNGMLAPLRGSRTPSINELTSTQAAVDLVKRSAPNAIVTSIVFPGSPFGSPYHYLIWTKGKTNLTSRLFQPMLVDARTGVLGQTVNMPWYLRLLEVSRPLHFGDYGGTPLKIIWCLLDLMTIVVLCSGIYLWIARWKNREQRLSELTASRPTVEAPGV